MTVKRKIATISLLLIISAPLFYALSFELQQQAIQGKMKKELEEKMLHSITLTNDQFHWVRDGKEIIINDQLFDVKSYSFNSDGSVRILGLFDNEESSLVQSIKKNQQQSGAEKQLVQFFQLQLGLPATSLSLESTVTDINSFRFTNFVSALPSAYLGIITPPPQC